MAPLIGVSESVGRLSTEYKDGWMSMQKQLPKRATRAAQSSLENLESLEGSLTSMAIVSTMCGGPYLSNVNVAFPGYGTTCCGQNRPRK